ncbi:MAG: LamB/YcsF family protein, partial [Verrucomicrobiota bacterium]|nr:LamB/YcsF family protein [Verrucomicrobiota bacterium]
PVTPGEVFALVTNQVGAFQAVATSLGVRPNHVKPHGALYNMAARDPALAEAVTNAILAVDRRLLLFAPAGSALARAAAAIALRVAREVFADRNYLPDGSLVPRTRPDALLHDAEEAAERVLRMLRENVVRAVDGSDVPLEVDTICLHGDKPEAVAFAQKLRAQLSAAGVKVAALSN